MKITKNTKISLKKISLLTSFVLLISLINIQGFTIEANAASKPQFTVTMDSYTPTNPKVGEEITVKGTIYPQDFEISIPAKEIVLVLDSSGSMADNSKMTNLKTAAKNFITKMKNVQNLKIAIVDFDTQASISNQLISASEVNTLNSSIDKLFAEGGTNTGEGLRQAAYLLSNSSEQSSTASKTIVFMSDGEPTYYNWQTTGQSGWTRDNYNGKYYKYYGGNNWNSYFLYNSDLDSDNMINKYDYSYKTGPYEGNYYGWKYQTAQEGYYTDITKSSRDSNVTREGLGSAGSDTNGYSLNYAKTIGEMIKAKGYTTFSIGYGLDNSGTTKMKQIHNSMSATTSNFFASDSGSIDSVFSAIGSTILDTYPITNVNFNFNPTGNTHTEVIGGNTVKLPDFNYKKVGSQTTGSTVKYTAAPVPFTIKIKENTDGNNIPVFANSTITFQWENQTITANVPTMNITIKDDMISTQFSMEVSDTTGIIDKYDTATQNPQSNRYDKADNQYKLLGDSYINIATQGSDINFAQYQFIKSDTKPTVLPNDNWNEIDLTKEETNDDVDVDKVGNLTQRSYDVSHLGTISDETKWNNREEVFKTPFEATTYKAASYSNTKEEYGGWQSYVKADGSTGQRWVTKSTFMNKMNIGLNDAQNKDYKEASKFWGYIKVPIAGSYNFAGTSDDGCSADITVNGTTVRIVDMFKVQGSTFGSTNKTLELEANKYYPIYIEYFNWGGEAEFRLQYKESSSNNWQNIPQNYFYPSKSTAPGEYATNRFTGRAGIKIPDEVGKYYIAYRTGKRDANNSITEIQKSGIYGAFIRDERFVLSRLLNNNGADNIGDEFEINYTITPNDIPVTDIYKNYQAGITNIANTLTSSNLKIQQVLPDGLTYVGASDNVNIVNNSNEISGVINSNVVYNLVGSTYKAAPITITIKVKPTIEGTFNLLKDNSILTYTDVSIDATKQGAQRQAYFPDFSLNVNGEYSVILKHGIYDTSSTNYINENNLNIVNTMPTALAMLVDVKSSNSVINWSINDIGKISNENSEIVFKQYEISNMSTPVKTVPLNISGGSVSISNSNGFNMVKDTEYIIVYTITPKANATESITIGANIEGSSSKPLTLNIKALPDLF